MLYLLFGTQQVMERGCRNLEERLELYMDGERVELPEIESIVILNIPSWGAGCRLWEMLDASEYLVCSCLCYHRVILECKLSKKSKTLKSSNLIFCCRYCWRAEYQ